MVKWNVLILIILQFLFASRDTHETGTQSSWDDIKKYFITDVNKFYLDKVSTHQIVLFGEAEHWHHAFYQNIIGFLEYWLEGIEENAQPASKIALILEASELHQKQLNEFFQSGDFSQLDCVLFEHARLNNLEFLYNLGKIYRRVNELKSKFDVDFLILGLEKAIPVTAPREELYEYITQRDLYVAQNIMKSFDQHPGFRFIALYGGGHIRKSKDPRHDSTPLLKHLIDQGIDTYAIWLESFDTGLYPLPFDSISSDFLIESEILQTISPKLDPTFCDAHAFFRTPFVATPAMKDIPSVRVIQQTLDYAKQSPQFIPPLVSLWHRYTAELIFDKNDVLHYAESNLQCVNSIAAIDDLSLFENLLTEFEMRKLPRQEIDIVMRDLTGFNNYFIHHKDPIQVNPILTAKEAWMDYIKKNKDMIQMSLYIAVLFYGREDEIKMAKQRLLSLTGKEFETPLRWLDFHRRKWIEK